MGLGGIVSGLVSGSGSKKAYEAQLQAALMQKQEMKNAYNDISNSYQPYIDTGKGFYDNYANTIRGDTSSFSASPWGQAYNQYVLDNTMNAIQGSAAAKGSLLSGNTLKELQTNIQSINSNDYLNRLNNYLAYAGGLGNQSLGLTQQLGNYRWNQASGNANAWGNIGQAKAAQQLQKYQNLGQVWGGIADLGANAALSAATGGLGGFAGAFI